MDKLDIFRTTLSNSDSWSDFFDLTDDKVLQGLMALSNAKIGPLNESFGKSSDRCPTCGK